MVIVALSYGELESHLETISNIKPFINKHNWKKKIFQQKYMPGKRLRKIIEPLLLIFLIY